MSLSSCRTQPSEANKELPTVATFISTQVPLTTSIPGEITPPSIDWQDLPIIPDLTPEAIAIYQRGLSLGNNPRAFTKIGDGEISAGWFLKIYDGDPQNYQLGAHQDLEQTIAYFSGSFRHSSAAAKRGFNTTKILDPKMSDRALCHKDESPLKCEIRLYRPSFALISLGTNQVWEAEIFIPELQKIIETLIENGVVPILSTKADNLEGDHRINIAIAELAKKYHLPLWNFWKVCQDLPSHGLQIDQEHLTYIQDYDFTNRTTMSYAWPNRNLTALQVLDMLYQSLSIH